MPLFFAELLAIHRGDALPRVRPSADYLRWLGEQDDEAAMHAWRESLQDLDGPTLLAAPHDASPALPENLRGGFSPSLTAQLQAFARVRGLTLNTIVQGLWAVLLARLTGRDDVVFGVTVSGRPAELAGIEQMIGLFINALPRRVRVDTDEPLHALFTRIQESQSRLLPYQYIGLGRIQRAIGMNVLFDTLVVYENYPVDASSFASLDGLRVSAAESRDGVHFPLSLVVVPGDTLSLRLRYDPRRFTHARIEAMFAQLETLAEQLVADPERSVRSCSLVTKAARAVLPDPRIEIEAPLYEPVPQLVERIATLHADREAIRHAGRAWSYADLMARADAIGRSLLDRGVRSGEIVPIEGRKSFETVATMLGVMRAGGVMLMLDPNLPPQRRASMLEQCSTLVDGAAYIFFTSGSTGTPKGVLGSHQGLAHFLAWEGDTFEVGVDDRVSQLIHLSFDPMLRDIFLPLMRGATLCIPEPEEEADGERLLVWLRRERITIAHAVPSLARWWMKTAPSRGTSSLRWTLFAGEPLTGALVQQWRDAFAPNGSVANLYGPTETTLAKCAYRVPLDAPDGLLPVGDPLPQTQALVVARDGALCGIGEPGEVVLRTPFRAHGYITSEGVRDPGEHGYRTGDVGRYLPDGTLELIGRVDDQLKIRGVRIDANEIAAVLLSHPDVSECFVTARELEGEKRLIAYVVFRGPTALDRSLLAHAGERLPAFMVPSSIVVLPSMPLTRNGKLDRRALPDPAPQIDIRITPRNATEVVMARLWREVLGIDTVGMRDDFFNLGGHSLSALRLIARIAAELHVKLPVAAVFRHRTIEDLAAALRDSTLWSPLVPFRVAGSRPPLFCVHPQGGLALGYLELARALGEDQPFYGLQAIGMEAGQEPIEHIEAMAALYVDAIAEVIGDGPILLAGYSYGGRIAYEMAQQLRRAGKEIAVLALLDSASPSIEHPIADIDELTLLRNVMPELDEIETDAPLQTVVARARERGLVPADFDVDALQRFLRVYKSNIVAGRRYQLAPYDGRITLLQTEPRPGWDTLALQGIDTYDIHATHLTLLQPPAVHAVAERLRERIDHQRRKP
jgi:non-ribosomal peptide synthetase component F/thioesterase domain-containing protein